MLTLLSKVGKIAILILVAVTLKVGSRYIRGGYSVERPMNPEVKRLVESAQAKPVIETKSLGIQPIRSSGSVEQAQKRATKPRGTKRSLGLFAEQAQRDHDRIFGKRNQKQGPKRQVVHGTSGY